MHKRSFGSIPPTCEQDLFIDLFKRVPWLKGQACEEKIRAEQELFTELQAGAKSVKFDDINNESLMADIETIAENVSFVCKTPAGGSLFLGSRKVAERIV